MKQKCGACNKKAEFDNDAQQYYCQPCGWWMSV